MIHSLKGGAHPAEPPTAGSPLDILVVEDDRDTRSFIQAALSAQGHRTTLASDGEVAMAELDAHVFDLVISDVQLPKIDGFAIFRRLRSEMPSTHVILMTAYGKVEDAVTAMKEKAADYINKPFDLETLEQVVGQVAERLRLRSEFGQAQVQLTAMGPESSTIVGESPLIVGLQKRIDLISHSDGPVLITGESGTGKELIARAIHDRSSRRGKPFIAVNCASFPETLLEAELFGHERGAFTGAFRRREGRFKAADGGTLFLDEIAEMALPSQAKLLRVLQEGSFEPIGTNVTVKVDARVIYATNRDLNKMIEAGRFRDDLYYRLKVFDFHVPPLRERRADLPILIEYFYRQFNPGSFDPPHLSPAAWAALSQYSFPGNIRELEHIVEHAVVFARGEEIDLEHLPQEVRGNGVGRTKAAVGLRPLAIAAKEFEREYLLHALSIAKGNKTRAAEMLGISRKGLWEKLKSHRVPEPEPETSES